MSFLLACSFGMVVLAGGEFRSPSEALERYVLREDPSYRWEKLQDGVIGETAYAELILTSQTWRETVWKHRLFVIRPNNTDRRCRHAVLVIAGGRWREADAGTPQKLPREAGEFAALAEQLASPVAVLMNVPLEPMLGGLVEDQIISLTFDNYLKQGDPEWPLLLPMVKSAVRGMDAVMEFARQEWSLPLDSFTVTGGSKRGWTTWLVAAVDRRVKAIAPMVIDTLKMGAQMRHQLEAWGAYSSKLHDYTARKILGRMDSERGRALTRIVDPFAYRERLGMPKLIMIGTNDHYWPLDALNLYFDDLPGPKYILYVPNNRHGLNDLGRVLGGLTALHEQARGGRKLPALSWSFEQDGGGTTLRIESQPVPAKVQIWSARSDSRDFREATWSSRPTDRVGDQFVWTVQSPSKGWLAFFGEAVYQRPFGPLYLSTNVRLVAPPDDQGK